jgi:hypothetical protein
MKGSRTSVDFVWASATRSTTSFGKAGILEHLGNSLQRFIGGFAQFVEMPPVCFVLREHPALDTGKRTTGSMTFEFGSQVVYLVEWARYFLCVLRLESQGDEALLYEFQGAELFVRSAPELFRLIPKPSLLESFHDKLVQPEDLV